MKRPLFFTHTVSLLIGMMIPALLVGSAQELELPTELGHIRELRRALDEGGLPGLLQVAQSKRMDPPRINSRYFAEELGRKHTELIPLESAKRAFGLQVAQELDRLGDALRLAHNPDKRAEQASQLLDLSDWFQKQKGYGNYLLAARCENLSIVPLAHLTADLSFPLEKVKILNSRSMSKAEDREFRKEALNGEAPFPFIGLLKGDDFEQDKQMAAYWNREWKKMAAWCKANGVDPERGGEGMPKDLVFFVEERSREPFTTSVNWETNSHLGVVNGQVDANRSSLDSLILYRELVGRFPVEPPSWWTPDFSQSATEAAFSDAWDPFNLQHGPRYGSAARLFMQIQAGTFVDYETQMRLRAEKKKK